MRHRPSRRRCAAALCRWVLLLAAASGAGAAAAADELLADLDHRLARSSADAVNAHLVAQWSAAMAPLNHKTASCELHAVSLATRLSRSRNAVAAQAHGEALRAASGHCARFVLAMATLPEVPRVCGSVSSWGPAQTARELRRRIAAIDSDDVLRATRRGSTCRAAYLYELENTRVVVRRGAATPSGR